MKKALILLILALPLTVSCAALIAAQQESEKEGSELAMNALETGNIEIEVRDIMPQVGPTIHSNGEYFLRIRDGKASAYLPFFGTSTYATYGSSDGGFNFEECPVEIVVMKSRKSKGENKWEFIAKTDREPVEFIVTFWDSGSAGITTTSRTRSRMSYNGHLRPLPQE